MTLQFGELPEPQGHRNWQDEAEQLRARPGEWALLTTKRTMNDSRVLASRIRLGRMVSFEPKGHFQAVNRGLDVWVRYIGHRSQT